MSNPPPPPPRPPTAWQWLCAGFWIAVGFLAIYAIVCAAREALREAADKLNP